MLCHFCKVATIESYIIKSAVFWAFRKCMWLPWQLCTLVVKLKKPSETCDLFHFHIVKSHVWRGEGRDLPESSKKIKSHNLCTYYMLKICKWTNIDTLCLLNMTKSIYVVVKCSYLIFCWYNITLHNYSPCPVSRDHLMHVMFTF